MNVRDTNIGDVERLSKLHSAAFAGEIGPAVGPQYVGAFLSWFIKAPEAVSLLAEENGQFLGYTFGAPDGYGPRLTRDLLPVIGLGVIRNLGKIVAHPSFRRQVRSRTANILLRRDPRSAIADATPKGTFCLVGIGTDAAARGKGVGKALVHTLCERAGDRVVALDVFKDNGAALALYARCGFRVLVEEGRVVRMIRAPKPKDA